MTDRVRLRYPTILFPYVFLPVRRCLHNFPGIVSAVAIYVVAICFAGSLLAGAAFAWAALRGEFTDASQAAFLVFDDEDEPRPPEPTS